MKGIRIAIFFFLFAAFFFGAPRVHALTATLNPVEFSTIYSYQQDNLLLDLTIVPKTSGETLKALAVKDLLSSSTASQFASLELWSDNGAPGYQGWLTDVDVASATMDSNGVWAFSGLSLAMPENGLRLYVTGTAGQILNRRYLVQFGLLALSDGNTDGKYQTGDTGVFVDPVDNGPTEALVNPNTKELSPSSVLVPPQSAITSPKHGDTVAKDNDILVVGKARGVGGSPAVVVQLRWGAAATVGSAAWNTVTSATTITDWQYHWKPNAQGDVVLETRAVDSNGQTGAVGSITLHVGPSPVSTPTPTPPLDPYQGSLVRTADNAAVYYVYNGSRWAFPNDKIFKSWYTDFSSVNVVTNEQLASWRLAGVVTYRPGVRLVKLQTDPKVYTVSKGGVLRWVSTEAAAVKQFGSAWSTMIDDLSDAFFPQYRVGEPLNESSPYSVFSEQAMSTTIAVDKSL
ncbi:hypothetical protein HZA86_00750 [Candidatus Uhrbacteria bacterium]|nr:hypothetical protein [Candidatus Uhrbacteria bacterium]